MPKKNHQGTFDVEDYHQPKGGAAQKGCYYRHITSYVEGHKCSHRWQAYKQAEETDQELYNWDKYETLVGKQFKTGSRITKKGKARKANEDSYNVKTDVYPPDHHTNAQGPEEGDWDIPGDRRRS